MPLGTLDRDPPPFFRQGPSALSRLAVCAALSVLLMVGDGRFQVMQPIRLVLGTILYPVQWLVLQPVLGVAKLTDYMTSVVDAQTQLDTVRAHQSDLALRAAQVDELMLENTRLRNLFSMGERQKVHYVAGQVLFDAADPFNRKVIVNRGSMHNVRLGAPVLDEYGVLGQVTRLYPMSSEVTLLTDRDHAIPVLNVRTGARGVAFGDNTVHADAMELRYMAANADVVEGDLLTTSGVDGVYPAGLPVAKVEKIERKVDAAFARIYCKPVAMVAGAMHVLLLDVPDAGESKP